MRESIKYSVIIPFYNAEKTLRRCLDSLAGQVRNDIEIILINDGSRDSSKQIALEYEQRFSAFQLIDQENAGVSCARNAGLDVAKGEYVTFVDSDDYVRSDYFAVLDQNEDCDLLAFCHEIIGYDPRSMPDLFSELQKKESFNQRLELLLSSRRIMSPWDKRFKKSIIDANYIRFPEKMQIGEDFNFCMAYAVQCQEIKIESAQIIYNDITGVDSLSRKYRPNLDQQMVDAFTKVAETIRNSPQPQEMKDQLLAITDYLFVKHTFSCISEKFKIGDLSYIKNRDEIVDICRKFQVPLSEKRCCTLHTGFRLLLSWHLYFPFYYASRMKKRRSFMRQAEGKDR